MRDNKTSEVKENITTILLIIIIALVLMFFPILWDYDVPISPYRALGIYDWTIPILLILICLTIISYLRRR
jgi:hypothetical protein